MIISISKLQRPRPPNELLDVSNEDLFAPANDLREWMYRAFILDGSRLYNPAHDALQMASIGVLWSNVRCDRKMLPVVGTMRLTTPNPMQDDWAKGLQRHQLRSFFGHIPDFLMTLYAPYLASCDNATFCAIIEHELLHARLKYITRKGKPIWGIIGHDVEEHVNIVERYGVGAAAGRTRDLVLAAKKKPLIAAAQLDWACGNQLRRAA